MTVLRRVCPACGHEAPACAFPRISSERPHRPRRRCPSCGREAAAWLFRPVWLRPRPVCTARA